jgi:dihydroflavonol-4-reductase
MSTNECRGTVLLTGGSCFLARWTIIELLQRGYAVRATLRNPSRHISVRATIARYVQNTDRLSFLAADLSRD